MSRPMFLRGAVLLCGVALAVAVPSGVAYASHGDDGGGDRRGGGVTDTRCTGDHSRDGRRGAGARHSRGQDGESRETDGRHSGRSRPTSCGGRGGAPGFNSSSCGSSLLPAGVASTDCAAPRARRGRDG